MCCLRISASVWLHRNVRRRPSEQHWLASSAHLLCRSAGLGQRRLILPLSILPSLPFALLASIFPTPGLPFHPSRNQPPSKVSEMQCQARTRPAKWISVFVAKQLGSAGFHYKSKSHSVLQLSRLWKEAGCVGGSPPPTPSPSVRVIINPKTWHCSLVGVGRQFCGILVVAPGDGFNSAAPPHTAMWSMKPLSVWKTAAITQADPLVNPPHGSRGTGTDGFRPSMFVASELANVINETVVSVFLSYTTAISCLSE